MRFSPIEMIESRGLSSVFKFPIGERADFSELSAIAIQGFVGWILGFATLDVHTFVDCDCLGDGLNLVAVMVIP
jgi:hypothetical protein